MMRIFSRLTGLAVALLMTHASANDSSPPREIVSLVQEGDTVPGVGIITRIDNIALNANGEWIIECDTNNTNTDIDSVLLEGSISQAGFSLSFREGQAVNNPPGATIDTFDTVNINSSGSHGWNFFLDGTSGSSDDSGLYFNTSLRIQEGDISNSPDLTPGTPYRGFFECKINDLDRLLLMGSVDDPNINSSVDRVLMIVDLVQETLVVKEGDILPGQTEPLVDLETGPHAFAFNNMSQSLYIAELDGDSAFDSAIYLDSTLLAQEGFSSPVAGRHWGSLASAAVALNNQGKTAIRGRLDSSDTASDAIIIVDNTKLVQEGDAFGGFAFTGFGTGPVDFGDNDRVLWYGEWDDPNTDIDSGLFVDGELLVQEGVTRINGILVDTLRGIQDGYALSPDGRFVIFEAILVNGLEGAFLIDLDGPWSNLGFGLAGTGGLEPCLTGRGSLAPGSTVSLELNQALPGTSANLVIGFSRIDVPFLGGTMVPSVDFLTVGLPVNALGELTLSTTFPSGIPSGTSLYLQYWINDPGGPQSYSASNAIQGVIP